MGKSLLHLVNSVPLEYLLECKEIQKRLTSIRLLGTAKPVVLGCFHVVILWIRKKALIFLMLPAAMKKKRDHHSNRIAFQTQPFSLNTVFVHFIHQKKKKNKFHHFIMTTIFFVHVQTKNSGLLY